MKLTDRRVINALKAGKRLRSEALDAGWFLCLGCCHDDIVIANEDNGAICRVAIW